MCVYFNTVFLKNYAQVYRSFYANLIFLWYMYVFLMQFPEYFAFHCKNGNGLRETIFIFRNM